MTARALVVTVLALTAAACGDGVIAEQPMEEPANGARLVTMWLGYDDGARQLRRDQVFDLDEEVPCRPLAWGDGVVRCTPFADEAVYADDACTQAVGRAWTIARPTHFIGHDRDANVLVPKRLYRAGRMIDPLQVLYERRDGACKGPFTAAGGLVHYAVGAQVDLATLATIDEVDGTSGERLDLRTWRSPDGLSMPAAVIDRELASPCDPAVEADGHVRCHPRVTFRTRWFADPACSEPVVIAEAPPVNLVVEVTGADGCPAYYRAGEERPGPTFVRTEGGCFSHHLDANEHVYAVTTPAQLARLERTVEDEPWRRLQRVVLSAGGLRAIDDRMHDTATGVDCRAADMGGVLRCLPERIATATTNLYGSETCSVPATVALLPQPTCGAARFARIPDEPAGTLGLIGDARTDLHAIVFGFCQPHAPVAGQVPYDVGPAIDPALFVRAVLFGDR